MKNNLSCTEFSKKAGEQIFGTAPRVDHWFLIEYTGNWSYNALESSQIPQMVKDFLADEMKEIPNSRIQLIKKDDNSSSPGFYYANSTEVEPSLYQFPIEQYVDILDLDLRSFVEKESIADYRTDRRFALVCTHGSHDRCCGTLGVPVYNKLGTERQIEAWRTSHVGGHRFSANVLMLPEGIYYGRVNESNISDILHAHLRNEIAIGNFRGRSCYSPTSQVCDYFLRDRLKKFGIYDIRWEYEKDRDYNVSVEFRIEGEDTGYSVNAVVMYDSMSLPASCGDIEYKDMHQFYYYSLIKYKPKQDGDKQ